MLTREIVNRQRSPHRGRFRVGVARGSKESRLRASDRPHPQLRDKVVAGAEVVVQRSHRRAALFGDRAHGRMLNAALEDELARRVENRIFRVHGVRRHGGSRLAGWQRCRSAARAYVLITRASALVSQPGRRASGTTPLKRSGPVPTATKRARSEPLSEGELQDEGVHRIAGPGVDHRRSDGVGRHESAGRSQDPAASVQAV